MTTPTVSELFLVDSSGWVEYFGEGPHAEVFAPYIELEESLLVPTIVLYEVYKKLLRERGKSLADGFASQAMRRIVVPLDEDLALAAAQASLDHRLAMADAVIYATAQARQAQLVTGDLHFRGLPGVIIP